MTPTRLSLDIATLQALYRSGTLTPSRLVSDIIDRIAAAGDDHVWISRVPDAALREAAAALDARQGEMGELPLFGIPFAVKDNIDVAGLPTTAGCPDFAYTPALSSPAVARLQRAGAILIGKTNLDQFATGLVGTRSPYGASRNPFDASFIPGGSSSGSAVAVSTGLVSIALGTDTAGSGRVPAAFNNIVGLKPTRGLIPTQGVVPACRSLDCVSIFALTVADAMAVLSVAQGEIPQAPYSRSAPAGYAAVVPAAPEHFRFAVPRRDQRRFFGNGAAEWLFDEATARLKSLGGEALEIDYAPFAAAAELLYGAFVSERTAEFTSILTGHPAALHPVTRRILESGRAYSAVDLMTAMHRLEALRAEASTLWDKVEFLVVPSAGTVYRIAEIEADPVQLNGNLGYYTNFANFFDLSAIAVPNGFQPDGLPSGISLLAPAWHEAPLAAIAAAFHRATGLTLGATGAPLPRPTKPAAHLAYPTMPIAVVGAHLSGMALNGELTSLGARLRHAARTTPTYRLYALPDGRRPGLVRVADGGAAIEIEVWDLPSVAYGAFVARISPPLGIGTIELDTGIGVPGFLCESYATAAATDITHYGGWRAYKTAGTVR